MNDEVNAFTSSFIVPASSFDGLPPEDTSLFRSHSTGRSRHRLIGSAGRGAAAGVAGGGAGFGLAHPDQRFLSRMIGRGIRAFFEADLLLFQALILQIRNHRILPRRL